MGSDNKKLLSEVITKNLEYVLENDANSEESKTRFKEAMEAISKQTEVYKAEQSHFEQMERMKAEEIRSRQEAESKKEEAAKDRWTQIGIFGAGLIASPLIDVLCKKAYAKMICEFEKDYSFTTSAGRALSGLFKFKK